MQSESSLSIVLVSGGMDSCVTAAIARGEADELAFLHASYSQRTEARERKAFNDIANFYGVEKRLDVSIEYLAKIGGSSLTDQSIAVTEANLESKEIPTSYVPFRNANMLSIAVSWAEVIGAERIYIGAVAEDSSGYPDCRPECDRHRNETGNTDRDSDADHSLVESGDCEKGNRAGRAAPSNVVVLSE